MTIEQLTYHAEEQGCTMVVLVDDDMLNKYRDHEDGVTATHVVDSFDIFKFESGKQGNMLRPSKTELQAIFGTTKVDQAIDFMLEKGELPTHRTKKGNERDGSKQDPHSRFHVERSGRPL
jgi:ribosome maturation protein Sdo1